LVQITYTRPCRLTSLQFSQIRLTLERTFMVILDRALESTPFGQTLIVRTGLAPTRVREKKKNRAQADPLAASIG
jgi:hypothetical protein